MICSDCLRKFSAIDGQGCMRCGRPLVETAVNCSDCRSKGFNLQQARACFAYTEPLTSVVKRYKYDGLFALATPLATLMAQKWPRWAQLADVIVPIPLHGRRQRSRGFNQADLLAHQLGPLIGMDVSNTILRRVRYTKPQIGLNPLERKENVWEAFAAGTGGLQGIRILLLDDVFTTGATLTSAAGALLQAGASSVSAYCLARAVQ